MADQAPVCAAPQRDPRVDPQPGDVLRIGPYPFYRQYFEVLERDYRLGPTDVSYIDVSTGRESALSIREWRTAMQSADVLRVERTAERMAAPREEGR